MDTGTPRRRDERPPPEQIACTRCEASEKSLANTAKAWTATAMKLTELCEATQALLDETGDFTSSSKALANLQHLLRTWGYLDEGPDP